MQLKFSRDIGCLAEADLVRPMQGAADRVLLGLLPSSQCAWKAALVALKDQGGWLHLHNNVKDSEEAAWSHTTLVCLGPFQCDARKVAICRNST